MSLRTTVDFQLDQPEKEGIWILDLRGHLIIGDSEAIVRSNGVLKLRSLPLHLSLMALTKLDTVFDRGAGCGEQLPDRAVRHYDILEWVQEQGKRQAPDLPE